MDKQNIRIKLRAYDNKVLDASTEEIVNTVKRTGASNGDHLRDQTGTSRCVPPPPEHEVRQTTDHWLQQPQETPKLSLEPGKHCFFQKHFTHTY